MLDLLCKSCTQSLYLIARFHCVSRAITCLELRHRMGAHEPRKRKLMRKRRNPSATGCVPRAIFARSAAGSAPSAVRIAHNMCRADHRRERWGDSGGGGGDSARSGGWGSWRGGGGSTARRCRSCARPRSGTRPCCRALRTLWTTCCSPPPATAIPPPQLTGRLPHGLGAAPFSRPATPPR